MCPKWAHVRRPASTASYVGEVSSWTWGPHGVDLERDHLLWWDAVGPVSFAGGGASEQSFADFRANGPAVGSVPDDVLAELRARLTVSIRPARVEDAAAVASVRVESWRHAYAHLLSAGFLAALDPAAEIDRWRGTIAAMLEQPDRGRFVVVELDGAVRGFAIAGPPRPLPGEEPPREWQLFLLYLDAALYGTGAGQSLLEASVGDRPAHLWTAEDNPRAIAFYTRNGFVADGERTVSEEWENLAEIRMVR